MQEGWAKAYADNPQNGVGSLLAYLKLKDAVRGCSARKGMAGGGNPLYTLWGKENQVMRTNLGIAPC